MKQLPMEPSIPVTWRMLNPEGVARGAYENPDELVTHKCSSGHIDNLYVHNCAVAHRAVERAKELGGKDFHVSPEIANMLLHPCPEVYGPDWAHYFNFAFHCNHDLPPNSIVKMEWEEIGDVADGTVTLPTGQELSLEGSKFFIPKPIGG